MIEELIGNKTTSHQKLTNEDMKAGFVIYSATVFCANTPKQLYKFFFNLVSKETPRSMLLALVNTVRSKSVKDFSNQLQLNRFYFAMDRVLKLMYGDILVATSSKADLQGMINNGWPFFTNNTEMVKKCILGNFCKAVPMVTKSLRK